VKYHCHSERSLDSEKSTISILVVFVYRCFVVSRQVQASRHVSRLIVESYALELLANSTYVATRCFPLLGSRGLKPCFSCVSNFLVIMPMIDFVTRVQSRMSMYISRYSVVVGTGILEVQVNRSCVTMNFDQRSKDELP